MYMKANISFKNVLFFVFTLIFLLNLPVGISASFLKRDSEKVKKNASSEILSMYDQLQLRQMGLSQNAFVLAMQGFEKLKLAGKIINQQVISIIDFSKSSNEKRLFVFDVGSGCLLFNTYVAHGRNSGAEFAKCFSNQPSSNQSSLGFFETCNTYFGKHGYSLTLRGLEIGINDLANQRSIVFHGASYVSEAVIRTQGYLGRSLGCPAVPEKLSKPIIDKIKNGSCLFIYSNDQNYLNKSSLVHS